MNAADVLLMRPVLWRWYGAVGLVAVGLYPLVPVGIWQDVAYVALGASSVAAIVVGVGRQPPRAPRCRGT